MRTTIAGTAVAIVALVATSGVGVAAAETTPSPSPSSAPPRTVSVTGVAAVPLAQGASAATATAAYRQAMAGAEADAHQKAEFLAEKAGAGIGVVQSIAEGGGEISCTGGEEGNYAEYQGEQPDFGESSASPSPFERAAVAPPAAKPVAQHHRKRKQKHKHKKAAAKKATVANSAPTTCKLSARVALAYALS